MRADRLCVPQLFYKVFRTLEGKEVVVELKNDFALRGTLHSVDQYMNIKLENVSVVDEARFPQLVRMHERAVQALAVPRSWCQRTRSDTRNAPVSAGACVAAAAARHDWTVHCVPCSCL